MSAEFSSSREPQVWNESTSGSDIERWLAHNIALFLDVPPRTIDVTARFVELGLDSVMALAVAGELELVSGLCFSQDLLSEHDNPRALARFVVRQLARESGTS